ncbi:MAG: hypothetical protein U0V70_08595 [Terriglobia bacterium]
MIKWTGLGLAGVLLLVALDQLGLWLERKGWLYYRHSKPSSSQLGNALLELQSILEPSKQHVMEVRLEERDQKPDSGDPPKSGAH